MSRDLAERIRALPRDRGDDNYDTVSRQAVLALLAEATPAAPDEEGRDLLQDALDVDRLAQALHDSGCRRGTLCGRWGHRENAARIARALASQDKAEEKA